MENIFATFLQTAGLYDSKEICEDNIADLIELLKGNVKISAYCKECKQERVFHMKPIEYYFETATRRREFSSAGCVILFDFQPSLSVFCSPSRV